jgi:hypothetical protein
LVIGIEFERLTGWTKPRQVVQKTHASGFSASTLTLVASTREIGRTGPSTAFSIKLSGKFRFVDGSGQGQAEN